jgi:V/A-type H+-transporting ATPase subunit I
MAIAKIKKIEIIGLGKDKEALLALLQKLGVVQLINIQETAQDIDAKTPLGAVNLLEIEEAVSFLSTFREKAGFLEGMVNLKPIVYQRELKEVINNFNCEGLLKELSELRSHLRNLAQHRERLIQERHLLIPWRKLSIPLDQLHYTKNCGILLGVLRTGDYTNLIENCQEEAIDLFCEAIHQDKTNTYLVIVYLKERFERLEVLLKTHHFNFVTLSRHKCAVRDRLLEINREVLVLDDQLQDAKNKIVALSKERFKLEIFYDCLSNRKKLEEADKDLAKQKFTFILSGWAKYKDARALESKVTGNFKQIAMFISSPREDENAPVVLENRRLIQPFEFITQIYGMPKYNELDPTPFLAPFFFLYFGFCVSDAGYGLILVAVSFFILKKLKLGPQASRFWRLFLFCGISTIIIGALTGSWFGNLLDLLGESHKTFLPLKRFKDALVLLDPLKEPTKLLGIALILGIIQVWFGNIVAAIGNLKNRRYPGIILDQIPMLTLLFGLTGLGLMFLKLLNTAHNNLFKNTTLLAAVVLILTQGRSEKGMGAKLFYGIYNLYNALSGYLSDILSYSRLWALGLVTGVMATTINLIAVQLSQIFASMIPFIEKIIVIKVIVTALVIVAIFILGHSVSFLINLIGAFVHPLRLQFVEFFSKFFKSGGDTFKPFKLETKYINISQ